MNSAENKEGKASETSAEEKRLLKDQRLSVFEEYLKKRKSGRGDRGG